MYKLLLGIVLVALAACTSPTTESQENSTDSSDSTSAYQETSASEQIHYEGEKHLTNIRQLSYGGDNAEAYWSFADDKLVYQVTNPGAGIECDQIYMYDLNEGDNKLEDADLISTGKGRTTCSYFMPGDSTIVYASTHLGGEECPPVPERRSGRYVWPIYPSFDIFEADLQGNIIRQLTNEEGYDAEATVSPKGDKIIFTSLRSGDLELYTMDIDGSNVTQITSDLGYDGGAFFSPDGSKIVWRASRPQTDEEIEKYTSLLAEGLVEPTNMELFVANADGTDAQQVTNLGQANWCPFFHPSGEKLIFASNHRSERGFPFNLYLINIDGTGLEQITHDGTFDAFPVFSNDGKKLVFSSNRNNGGTRDTNIFIADWVE